MSRHPLRSPFRSALRPHAAVVVLAPLALALAFWLGTAPAPAFAAGTAAPLASEIASEQAQVAQLAAQLAAERSGLATKLADFQRLNEALAATRQEIAEETTQLVTIEGALAQQQAALDGRAMHLYQSSGQDFVTVLLGTRSLSDLVARIDYLMMVSDYDAQLVENVKAAREQIIGVMAALERRQAEQVALQRQAEATLQQMQNEIAAKKGKLTAAQAAVAQLVQQQQQLLEAAADAAPIVDGSFSGAAPIGSFSPNTIISDAKFLAATSMSAADIQSFLAGQPGTLKSYSAPDYAGVTKTAAQMIAEASQAWGVSPKVILVTLQKEQSLIANPNPTQYAYDWAMGCGKTDSRTLTKYKGFGNQIWFGAKTLADHRADWRPGMSLQIDGASVYPTNASTRSLYSYTPHFTGNTSFWTLYWRYFGDPL